MHWYVGTAALQRDHVTKQGSALCNTYSLSRPSEQSAGKQRYLMGLQCLHTCIKNSSRQLSRLSKDRCELTSYTSTQQSAPR